MALGLPMNETYSLEDTYCRWPSAQYVWAIICHGLEYNIVDIANQLLFAYRSLVLELWVFITLVTNITKIADFIQILEKKQEI